MRIYLTISILIIACLDMFGQSVPTLRNIGDDHFQNERYLEAIEYYQKVVGLDKNDTDTRFKLARAYFKTFRFEKSKKALMPLIDQPDKTLSAEALLYFGNILKLNERYIEADSVYKKLITEYDVSENILEHARKEREGCLLAINQTGQKKGYRINFLDDLNSELHDFGATVNRNLKSLVYVTSSKVSGQQFQSAQFSGLLPDLVQEQNLNGKWRNASNKNNFDRLNSPWAEGSGSFTRNGKTFFFTSCKESEGAECKIFYSKFINEKWSEPTAVNQYINLDGYENKQPFVTPGGDTLFFVSNRPGGIGGSDIWMSLKGLKENSWSPAINLGEVINTEYDEITPFFSTEFECLAFSSNGHVGYGGYDIFIAKGESFFEPNIYNIGYPFNSSLDDTYFGIYDSIGYISSNRKDLVHLNIYDFEVNDERLFLSLLISGQSLIDERVISRYKQIRSLDLTTFRIEDYQGFELFDPVKRKKPKPEILRNSPPNEESDEVIIAENTSDTKNNRTNNNGYNNTSSERNYTADFIKGNYSDNDGLISYDFERVYFGFGNDELNRDAKITLKKLVQQLKQAGNFDHIEVEVYSDPVGPAEYNLQLSNERGQAVKAFLVNQGLPEVSVEVIPKGESQLLSTGSRWYDNFFNRRAEIKIFTEETLSIEKSHKLIVRENMSVKAAAERLGIDEVLLKKWNELPGNQLLQGDIIRIDARLYTAPDINYFIDQVDITNQVFQYRLKEGESIESVSRKFNTPEELIMEINNLQDYPQPGDLLYVYGR